MTRCGRRKWRCPVRRTRRRLAPTEASRRWAALARQITEVDPLACPSCHGVMRISAFITQASVINQILTHRRTRGFPNLTPTPRRRAGTFGTRVRPTGASTRSPPAPHAPRGPRPALPALPARGEHGARTPRGRSSPRRRAVVYSTGPDSMWRRRTRGRGAGSSAGPRAHTRAWTDGWRQAWPESPGRRVRWES
jgi:hypothetical protein